LVQIITSCFGYDQTVTSQVQYLYSKAYWIQRIEQSNSLRNFLIKILSLYSTIVKSTHVSVRKYIINNNDNNNNGPRGGEWNCPHLLQGHTMQTQPRYAPDRPCLMMNHILQEVALLINRTRQRYRSTPKQCPSPGCALACWRTTGTPVVGDKKSRTRNSDKWRPLISSGLTATGKTIPQQKEYIPSHSWDSDGHKNTKSYKNRKERV